MKYARYGDLWGNRDLKLPGKFCMVVEIGLFLGNRCRGGFVAPLPLVGLIYKITCFKFQIASYKGFQNHAKFAR